MTKNSPRSNDAYDIRLKKRAKIELNKLIYRLRRCPIEDRHDVINEITDHKSMWSIIHFLTRTLSGGVPQSKLSFGEITPYTDKHPERNRLKFERGILGSYYIMGAHKMTESLKSVARVLYYLNERDMNNFINRVLAPDTQAEKMARLKRRAVHYTTQFMTKKLPHYSRFILSRNYRQFVDLYHTPDQNQREG